MHFLFIVLYFLITPCLSNADTSRDFITARDIVYNEIDGCIEAVGDVVIISDIYLITAKRVMYDIKKKELFAEGDVRIIDDKGRVVVASSILAKDNLNNAIIDNVAINFGDNLLITASRVKRLDKTHGELLYARYTPCPTCANKTPVWQILAQRAQIDLDAEKITYRNARFKIYNTSIFFLPYFSHPTPRAKAQSGFLMPSIKNGRIDLPFYYRAKKNLDFTFTPMIRFGKDILYAAEARYIEKNCRFNLNTSVINSIFSKQRDDDDFRYDKHYRYYVNADFNSKYKNREYGVNVKIVSDKSFLKNYYDIYDPYLVSRFYTSSANGTNFNVLEAMNFDSMMIEDHAIYHQATLPEFNISHTIPFGYDADSYLKIENNSLNYIAKNKARIARIVNTLSIGSNWITYGGHVVNIEAHNTLYHYSQYSVNNYSDKAQKRRLHSSRYLPEMRIGWRYPLIKFSGNNTTIIEPKSLLLIGSNKIQNTQSTLIDAGYYSISDENLFRPNHYSGYDLREYGTRVVYGVDTSTEIGKNLTLYAFAGKMLYLTDTKPIDIGPSDINKVSISNGDMTIYYKFNSKGRYRKIHDSDIGIKSSNGNIKGEIILLHRASTKKYSYFQEAFEFTPKVRQGVVDATYDLNKHWVIGARARFGIEKGQVITPLYHHLRISHNSDCFKVSFSFGHNYMSDKRRNVVKDKGYSFAIGFKTLGM